jgi:hypothetical protein
MTTRLTRQRFRPRQIAIERTPRQNMPVWGQRTSGAIRAHKTRGNVMSPLLRSICSVVLVWSASVPARADDSAMETIDKAIKALGGEEKLAKATILSWKATGTLNFGGNSSDFKSEAVAEGLDHYRSKFEADFNGNAFEAVTVVSGKNGWRKFGDNVMTLDGDGLNNEMRNIYTRVVPTTLVALKGKGFKVESAADEKIGEKMAKVVKVTAPEGGTFELCFDPETHLPAKMRATMAGFGDGPEFVLETSYADYKDMSGIKKATKITSKRDGEPFLEETIKEFSVLEKTEPGTFDEPK